MVYNHLAIYFYFTEFESCSINSTRGTDEAHCQALDTLCRTTAQGRQELVLQERSASGRYASFFWKLRLAIEISRSIFNNDE